MSSAQSNRDVEAGCALRPRPFGLTGSSAMNSAHERIVLLADNGRTAYSSQAGSRYRYEGTPFAWGPIQGQIRRLGLQCQLPCVFKRGPTDECLIPMSPPYLVGDATGRNLHHVVVASVVPDTSKPLPLPDNPRLFRGGPSLGKAESDP